MQQGNDEVNCDLYQGEDNEAEQSDINQNSATSHCFSGNAILSAQIHTTLTDDELSEKVRSLNVKQRQVFDFIYNWAKSCISKCANGKQVPVPFHIFLSGGGGYGKSHLIKTIYHSINKVFLYQSENPEKPRVLVLAPTGVSAININGSTIHSGLNIPCRGKLMPLSDKNRAELRNKYSEVQVIVVDEISMLSGKLLYQVHRCLNEIFHPLQDIPFGGKAVLVCGDFYQLPPVQGKPVFMFNETNTSGGFLMLDLWRKFRLVELTEIMCQRGDAKFIELLNNIRVGTINTSIDDTLKALFIQYPETPYPYDALHIYAENNPANIYNEHMLNSLPGRLITIPAKDNIPKNCSMKDVLEAQNQKQSNTGGLAVLLKMKVNVRVMVTTNVDLSDRLRNGQIGTVKYFGLNQNEVDTIYVAFDDTSAGQKRINGNDVIARNNRWVPISREETSIYISKNRTTSPAINRTQFHAIMGMYSP